MNNTKPSRDSRRAILNLTANQQDHMNNLLYIPFRKTKETKLADHLKAVIKKDYFQSPSIFENDISQLSKIRKKVQGLKDETVDKSTEIILQQYYIQIVNLTKKFADEVLEFEWYGTLGYKPTGPYTMRSLRFEKYNIIYQLGSLYSQLGYKELRFTDDGVKRACNFLQMSAGCFEYLAELILEDKHLPNQANDLSFDTLQHLKYLMLSEAQECIWQKSVNSELKNSVVLKLLMETANLYSKAWEYGNKSDFIKLEFVNYCAVKHYHFSGAAYYRMSLILLDNSKYGEQVGYLRIADELCSKGLKYKSYVKSYVVDDLVGLQSMVSGSLRVAERDNDLIYLKPVPELSTLNISNGTATSMVKPIVIDELVNPLKSDRLFMKDLLPYLIIQVSLAYRDRHDTFIMKNILEPLQALNKMMNHFLTQRHLPATIDSIQKPENLPESIIQHSQDIINYGGNKLIEDLYDNILQLSSECRDIYEGCHLRLLIEMDEDQLFRERYGDAWTRETSESAGKELWFKINSMNEYLNQADKADDIILESYHDIKDYLELYCGGYESLIQFIPNSTYINLNQEVTDVINDIREALNETSEMESARREFLKNLETKSRDNNILPKLIGEYKQLSNKPDFTNDVSEADFEPVYRQHMRLFNDDMQFVETLKNKQMVLEQKIDELNNKFNELYHGDNEPHPNTERKDSLQVLEDIYSRYLQLITNINEARKFYNDFKGRGNVVIGECDEFINKRREEAQKFELTSAKPQPSRVITPIPIVASPRPRSPRPKAGGASGGVAGLKAPRSDNVTPVTEDINRLQEQFAQTSFKKR